MKQNFQPELFKMKTLSRPLGDFCEGFKWVEGGFGPKTEEIAFADLPDIEGKVCCRLEDSESIVYDLAWGEYSEIGSFRATMKYFK
jgi:hypothetical protein